MSNASLAARAGRTPEAGVRQSSILPASVVEFIEKLAVEKAVSKNNMLSILIEEGLRSLIEYKQPHELKPLSQREFESVKAKLSRLS